jgi:hypothetical protein
MGAWDERSQRRNRLLGIDEIRWPVLRWAKGEVAEWSNAAVFLEVEGCYAGFSHQLPTGVGGSNPPLSALIAGDRFPQGRSSRPSGVRT